MLADDLRALVFDVFGTCVDWRGSVIRAGEGLGRKRGLNVDWPRFADEWRREGYIGPIAKIRSGEMPYVSSDVLFRRTLDIGPGHLRAVAAALSLATIPLGLTVSALAQLAVLVLFLSGSLLLEARAARSPSGSRARR